MTRRHRIVFLIAAVLPVSAVLLLAFAWTWRVEVASWAVSRELVARGFTDADIRITEIGLSHLELAPSRLGTDVAFQRLSASFNFDDLRARRFGQARITIVGLDADISAPRTGVLGRIQEIVDKDRTSETPTELPQLPKILFQDAQLKRRTDRVDLEVAFDGVVENSADGLRFEITRARVADSRQTPMFFPFDVVVRGTLKGPEANFNANMKAVDDLRLRLVGRHNLATTAGKLDWQLSPLRLGEAGIVISHLSPHVAALDTLQGELEGSGALSWEGETLTALAEVEIKEAKAIVGSVEVANGMGTFLASYSNSDAMIRWRADDFDADLLFDGRVGKISEFSASGHIRQDLTQARVTLYHARLDSNEFAALKLRGSGELRSLTKVTADLLTNTVDDRLKATALIEHDLAGSSGKALLVLAPVTFQNDRFQPSAVSRHLVFPGQLGGTLSGSANLFWKDGERDGEAFVKLNKVGYAAKGTAIRNLNGNLHAITTGIGGPLSFKLETTTAEVSTQGHEFALGPLSSKGTWHAGAFSAQGAAASVRHIALQPWFRPFGVTYAAKGNRETIKFDAKVDQRGSVRLLASGQYDLSRNDFNAALSTPSLTFSENGLRPTQISPLLDKIERLSGKIESTATVGFRNGTLKGEGNVRFAEIDIHHGGNRVEGLNGTVDLKSLNPPQTRGVQTLRARRVFAGTELANPNMDYSIVPSPLGPLPRLSIEAAEIGIAGGKLTLPSTVFDPNRETHDVDIDLVGVDLKQIMDLIDVEGVSAEGELSGRLPLRISKDNVYVRNGELKAAGPGVLRIRSEAARQALAGGGEQVELVLDVLKDFQYRTLALNLDRRDDGSDVVQLTTEGNNPAVKWGRAFKLNVNLETNLDRLLAFALEAYRLSDEALRATLGRASGK